MKQVTKPITSCIADGRDSRTISCGSSSSKKEFVFVTNNGRDFRELFRAAELHPGLVIIVP
jgi:hypothetical protein